ncbi:hypothetical protein [Paraoerskovia marina]|uniref:hypothetical protein n=1 Tax=Paraoerskovia marina TaxID=545619 RepID=UPI0009F3758A|nr:hypothetical protein [Paraoerskovia marina]
MRRRRAVAAAIVAAGVTATARELGQALAGPDAPRWTRTNHAGNPVSLLEGPAVAVGTGLGALAGAPSARHGSAVAIAGLGAGAFGLVDDLTEDPSTRAKGLRGHLGALARGELTTGGLKVLGIGATAALAAAVVPRRSVGVGRVLDLAVDTALVAGAANLVNLLDLRPGRALKASVVGAVLLAPSSPGSTGAVVGAGVAAAPADLAGRDMLGDCGANALGAVLGAELAATAPRPVRCAVLAGIVGLTLASERVSFSAVIADNPVLHRLDTWGRGGEH